MAPWWQHDNRFAENGDLLLPESSQNRATPSIDIFTPWGEALARPCTGPWVEPRVVPRPGLLDHQGQGYSGTIDKLVDIVGGLAQDLREERALLRVLETEVQGKRRALEPSDDERPTKNRVLAIAPCTPQTATPDGSFHGSDEEGSEPGFERGRGRSQGFSSVLSTESPSRGPRNGLSGSSGRGEHMRTLDWPLSSKEKRSLNLARQ